MTAKLGQLEAEPIYMKIGAFLAEHGLWPSPGNYTLAYQVFADPASSVAEAVKTITADGIRLSQRDADRIIAEHGMPAATAPATAGTDPVMIGEATRQMEEFAAIIETSRAATQSYGRDLAAGAAELEEALGSASSLIEITRSMIARTKSAEQQLTAVRNEADGLKAKLAEAGQEARRDPLTGLPNRRAFEEHYAELQREGAIVSVAICDVDHFKRINDQYGHGVGDRMLRAVAELLDANCNGHFVARLGGEEFVVLFRGLTAAQSAEILDDARERLAAKHFKLRESDAPLGKVTFSAGIACGTSRAEEVPLARADALLYEAKNGGRNEVRVERI
ncbi:GGDEF domain-containing protein [Sphingosinicella sp. LHD-64]|uniref:GGDEF domain-containing protein n=1 Tax=Sphingosinicella sp. LHD-64 TaxID=3072139 RepID=UPI00280DCB53|nr:GGDEF domain-containing protein [Sphingosinicella sp. LHD-64]MDQ8757196.1 GGDEF domain-containing protein [Sphingosinicella sp. LHD-64]